MNQNQIYTLIANTIQQISASPYSPQLYEKLSRQWYNFRLYRQAWRIRVMGKHFIPVQENDTNLHSNGHNQQKTHHPENLQSPSRQPSFQNMQDVLGSIKPEQPKQSEQFANNLPNAEDKDIVYRQKRVRFADEQRDKERKDAQSNRNKNKKEKIAITNNSPYAKNGSIQSRYAVYESLLKNRKLKQHPNNVHTQTINDSNEIGEQTGAQPTSYPKIDSLKDHINQSYEVDRSASSDLKNESETTESVPKTNSLLSNRNEIIQKKNQPQSIAIQVNLDSQATFHRNAFAKAAEKRRLRQLEGEVLQQSQLIDSLRRELNMLYAAKKEELKM